MQIYFPYLLELFGIIAILWMMQAFPRFNLRHLGYAFPKREGLVALSLFALVFVLTFLFWMRGGITAENMLARRMEAAGFSLLPFGLALLQRRQPLRSTGWNRKLMRLGFLLGLVLALLVVFVSGKFQKIVDGVPVDASNTLLYLAVICLAEETIFRGFIQSRLVAWLGWVPGWLITAGLFILWQVARWIALPGDLAFNMIYTIVQALLLGWIMRKGGHVLAPGLYRIVSEWLLLL
jgi:membrane protease YdiL (CAAX protease family)